MESHWTARIYEVYWKISDTSPLLLTTRIPFTMMHTLLLAPCGQVSHTNALVLCSGSVPSDQSLVSFPSSILRLSWNHGVGCGANAALEPEHAAQVQSSSPFICTMACKLRRCKSIHAHCVISPAAAEYACSAFHSTSMKTKIRLLRRR